MTPQINDLITIKILEVFPYGVVGLYKSHKVYVDLIELSWKTPIPTESIPKVGDEIETIVINISHRHDSDYLASVRHLTPEEYPWHDPSVYKIGDEFIGEIDSINTFGCRALHPNGADVRILIDGIKNRLKKVKNSI